ncbi:MAG: hypothetical protein R2738_08890 [Bacteroides graminisolvens]
MRHLQLFMVLDFRERYHHFDQRVWCRSKQAQPVEISYDSYYGIRKVARMPDFMGATEWMDYRFARYTTTRDLTLTERLTSILLQMLIFSLCSKMVQNGKNLLYTAHGKIIKVMIGRVKYCVPHREARPFHQCNRCY